MTVTGVQGALELTRYQRSQNGMFIVRFPEDMSQNYEREGERGANVLL